MSSDLCCLDEDIVSGRMCNCEAEGSTYKDCPMNTRKRYPGQALFPPPESGMGSCSMLSSD